MPSGSRVNSTLGPDFIGHRQGRTVIQMLSPRIAAFPIVDHAEVGRGPCS